MKLSEKIENMRCDLHENELQDIFEEAEGLEARVKELEDGIRTHRDSMKKDDEFVFRSDSVLHAMLGEIEESPTTCPECGGKADNGHDRCTPPQPYCCTKCGPTFREAGE